MTAQPDTYRPAGAVSVQCPRCGRHQDLRETLVSRGEVRFSGVCATPVLGAGFCSTTLQLSAATHVFVSASASQH
jgi:hypothetical protein